MQGEPVAGEVGATLQQPEARRVFSPGKLSLGHRTLAVVGCTGSRGVWIVTHACTQDSRWLQQQC